MWRAKTVIHAMKTENLIAVRKAMLTDDYHLIQHKTWQPPTCSAYEDFPAAGACFTGYCDFATAPSIKDISDEFERVHAEVDAGQYCPILSFFCEWYDRTPRKQAFKELLPLVDAELTKRGARQI